jgi:excisionase family DNA binding protein
MRPAAAADRGRLPASKDVKRRRDSTSDTGGKRTNQLYAAMRQGKARLVRADGKARLLPNSLHSFLVELTATLNAGEPVYIIQNQAKLTTIEAAALLGVSRQFLVNLLTNEEIPYHKVGTHRRIDARDLMRYKARRDANRHKILKELAQTEAAQGLYDKIPAVLDGD